MLSWHVSLADSIWQKAGHKHVRLTCDLLHSPLEQVRTQQLSLFGQSMARSWRYGKDWKGEIHSGSCQR